jgi:hypothetical protein
MYVCMHVFGVNLRAVCDENVRVFLQSFVAQLHLKNVCMYVCMYVCTVHIYVCMYVCGYDIDGTACIADRIPSSKYLAKCSLPIATAT